MAIFRVDKIGAYGIIKDLPADEMPINAWSDGNNVRFRDNRIEKMTGIQDVYNYTVVAGLTTSQQVRESPWFVMPTTDGINYYWLYAGKNRIHVATNDGNGFEITRYSTATASSILYSATASIRWNGAQLAGLPILNNGVDTPQVWTMINPLTTRMIPITWDVDAGTTWATRTAGATRCEVFRSYREFGVALNLTEGANSYPRRVRWSHPAVPGSQPSSWEDTRVDKDASYKDLDETGTIVVDCLQLRDSNIVYKENETWLMQWIGGQYVMSFKQLFTTSGILSYECAKEFLGQHVVWTDSDIVIHDGSQIKSIINKRWQRYLFQNIDTTYYRNSFMAINYDKKEMWFCYPENGITEAYWPTKALIWSWVDDVWTIRDIPKASHMASGVIASTGNALTWGSLTGTWATWSGEWNSRIYTPAKKSLLIARPSDSASAVTVPKLLKADSTEYYDNVTFTSYIERTGLPLGAVTPDGTLRVDLEKIKYVTGLYPRINAAPGTIIKIYIGSQKHVTSSVVWENPIDFTVDTDYKVNCRVNARYIAVRFSCESAVNWSITGYDIEYRNAGRW